MCQYCMSQVTSLDHICPVRIKELAETGVSPGRPAISKSIQNFIDFADEFIQEETSILSECDDGFDTD
jgi:hypothetical protein